MADMDTQVAKLVDEIRSLVDDDSCIWWHRRMRWEDESLGDWIYYLERQTDPSDVLNEIAVMGDRLLGKQMCKQYTKAVQGVHRKALAMLASSEDPLWFSVKYKADATQLLST